ncbi:MAG: hypothetical protein H0V30_15120 [Chitinophagaceae bacterium]|jgi:hypothetical protein|nr:hypothetical protein [Chitinophagaceae bacterium]
MKNLLPGLSLAVVLMISVGCNNNSKTEEGTHTHDDGSTHMDHDTTKPVQQEFKVADTTKTDTSTHTHENGEKHSH